MVAGSARASPIFALVQVWGPDGAQTVDVNASGLAAGWSFNDVPSAMFALLNFALAGDVETDLISVRRGAGELVLWASAYSGPF